MHHFPKYKSEMSVYVLTLIRMWFSLETPLLHKTCNEFQNVCWKACGFSLKQMKYLSVLQKCIHICINVIFMTRVHHISHIQLFVYFGDEDSILAM